MRPSEILAAIINLDNETRVLEKNIERLRQQIEPNADRIEVIGFAQKDILFLLDDGASWEKLEERLSDLATGIIPDAAAEGAATAKPTRKPRADKGLPRRAHATEGRTSPLTPERRAALIEFMQRDSDPVTVRGLAACMATRLKVDTDAEIEALLCEDAATFVSWTMRREGDSVPVVVWGTSGQFDYLVGRLSTKSGDRIADTVALFNCTEYAAREAWKRLDPNAAANGDRARREAGAV